ncbi:SLC13 family permease [Cumulibacter manganitolerans]|uniref:SLC13 family permease n=1 Tax=Cumulibacter manganitolerans TaxID=1884992 RepID=UPI001294CD5D|nr:SLC13 family permease [Cumulibacter manganitolerans]
MSAAVLALLGRVWPVLLFLALIAVVAELLDVAGGFRVAAAAISRWGGGRTAVLFAWYCALCAVVTILLSIDTTAVLLTPVGIALARRLRLEPLPFAFAALWLANTASLLLPISNLTNLLAVHGPRISGRQLTQLAALPQLVLIVVTGLVLAVLFRGHLTGGYAHPEEGEREDPWLLAVCVLAVGCIGVAIVAGLTAWMAALAALLVLLGALGVRDRARLVAARLHTAVPVRAIGLALGLFLVVGLAAAYLTGAGGPLHGTVLSTGALVVIGAAGANLVNNLPAYLFLEPLAGDAHGVLGLLVGVNAGALLTPWGSLATVLWLQICRRRLVAVSTRRVLVYGLVLVPAVLLAVLAVL